MKKYISMLLLAAMPITVAPETSCLDTLSSTAFEGDTFHANADSGMCSGLGCVEKSSAVARKAFAKTLGAEDRAG